MNLRDMLNNLEEQPGTPGKQVVAKGTDSTAGQQDMATQALGRKQDAQSKLLKKNFLGLKNLQMEMGEFIPH